MVFLAYSVIEWIWVTISVFTLLPLVIMIRNYKYTSLNDYLVMALVFLSISVNAFLIPLNNHVPNLLLTELQLVTFYSQYFFMITVFYRMKWDRTPLPFTLVNLLYFLLLTALALFPQESFPGQDRLLVIAGELYRILGASLIVLVTFTVKPVTRTKEVSRCVNGWKAVGLLLIVGGTINLLNWHEWPLLSLTRDLFPLITVTCLLIFVWMAVLYPEALLFSQAQIMRTVSLYKTAQKKNREQTVVNINVSRLVNYLKMIIPPRVRGMGTLFTFNEEEELLIKRVSNKGVAIAIIIVFALFIDVLTNFFVEMNFSLTVTKIYAMQDLLLMGAGVAFLFPLRKFRNTVRPGKDIDEVIPDMIQGLESMVTGLKVMATCFSLTVVVQIIGVFLFGWRW